MRKVALSHKHTVNHNIKVLLVGSVPGFGDSISLLQDGIDLPMKVQNHRPKDVAQFGINLLPEPQVIVVARSATSQLSFGMPAVLLSQKPVILATSRTIRVALLLGFENFRLFISLILLESYRIVLQTKFN